MASTDDGMMMDFKDVSDQINEYRTNLQVTID